MPVLVCFHLKNACCLLIVTSYSYVYISQGSVATRLRWGGIFSSHTLCNIFAECGSERIL